MTQMSIFTRTPYMLAINWKLTDTADTVRQLSRHPNHATIRLRFWQRLSHQSTKYAISARKPTTWKFWRDSCSVCLPQSCQHFLSVALSSWKLVTRDRQSVVLASSSLAVHFLLVRMTVSTEHGVHVYCVVYTDDVPREPHHTHC